MTVIVWQFQVREGYERRFAEVYGSSGEWATLFRKSADYRGTELLRDEVTPRHYMTLDRWTSADAFEAFKRAHASEYEALDARCEGWTESEVKLGTWTTVDA
jgi:heme-degrading monooxygenase HmoA